MTRCQMRALKQLRELHEAYDKHDFALAGSARWSNTSEPIWKCPCGEFRYEGHKGQKESYTPDTASEWVCRVWQSLNNKDKELFKAYLKRIGWVSDSKKGARLIYGSKGMTRWHMLYGQYETKQDYIRAREEE